MLVTHNEPLWRWQSGHNSLRWALHALRIVLVFFPVPPSLRQAAGPLTENLPNVLAGYPRRVDLWLQRPSPRGTKRRLFLRVFAAALRKGWLSRLLSVIRVSCWQPWRS